MSTTFPPTPLPAASPARWARLALRLDGAFLLIVGTVAMVLEVVGHFGSVGPLAHLSHSPYTIGGFEAHGLAAILGALLIRNAANDDLRPWHVSALAIHLLLGGANLAFWLSFTAFGMVPMGIVTTVVHAVLVVAHALCIAGARRPAA